MDLMGINVVRPAFLSMILVLTVLFLCVYFCIEHFVSLVYCQTPLAVFPCKIILDMSRNI